MNIHRPLTRRLFFSMLFGACSLLLSAQNIDIQGEDDKPLEERLVYSHQNTYHAAIHSQGFGAGFKIGRIKSINKTRNWEAQLVSLHSHKEIKTINLSSYNSRPFVYGKLNDVFVLRFGYGEERRIFGKPYWGGIETRWTYETGASLALLKPYYYYVIAYRPDGNGGYFETIEEQTYSSGINILGKSSFSKGITETHLSPGVHASLGFCFEFGKTRSRVQSVNIDMKADCFPLGLSIMDSERQRRLFLTFSLSYNWGTRFNNY